MLKNDLCVNGLSYYFLMWDRQRVLLIVSLCGIGFSYYFLMRDGIILLFPYVGMDCLSISLCKRGDRLFLLLPYVGEGLIR